MTTGATTVEVTTGATTVEAVDWDGEPVALLDDDGQPLTDDAGEPLWAYTAAGIATVRAVTVT